MLYTNRGMINFRCARCGEIIEIDDSYFREDGLGYCMGCENLSRIEVVDIDKENTMNSMTNTQEQTLEKAYQEIVEDIKTLCDKGFSDKEIAEKTNHSIVWVRETIKAQHKELHSMTQEQNTTEVQKKEYKPTMERVCEMQGCTGYGKPLVDRGYGYPVCLTCPVAGHRWIEMHASYLE